MISNSRGRKLIYRIAHELNDGKQILLPVLSIEIHHNADASESEAEITSSFPFSNFRFFKVSSLLLHT